MGLSNHVAPSCPHVSCEPDTLWGRPSPCPPSSKPALAALLGSAPSPAFIAPSPPSQEIFIRNRNRERQEISKKVLTSLYARLKRTHTLRQPD